MWEVILFSHLQRSSGRITLIITTESPVNGYKRISAWDGRFRSELCHSGRKCRRRRWLDDNIFGGVFICGVEEEMFKNPFSIENSNWTGWLMTVVTVITKQTGAIDESGTPPTPMPELGFDRHLLSCILASKVKGNKLKGENAIRFLCIWMIIYESFANGRTEMTARESRV